MPIDIQWYCSGLVLYVRFAGSITVADTIEYSSTIQRFIDSSDAPLVHMITDLSAIQDYPSLRDTMKHVRMPARTGWSLVIGLSVGTMLRFIAHVVSSTLRLRFREVETLDEGLAFLQKMDSTLPDLQMYRHVIDEPVPVR